MVAENPLFRGRWNMKKFSATVVGDIWPEVTFFSLIATMVTLISKHTRHKLAIPNGLLTVLGTVLGLVISFRTSSAYERYQEGRKMWTNIMVGSRNLAMMFWVHVPSERETPGVSQEKATLQGVIEKKTMVNLIQAFSVSVKHFLRSEPGVYYQDLYPLISFLPRYANPKGTHTKADKVPLWSSSDDIEEAHGHKRNWGNPRSAADTAENHPQRTESLPAHLNPTTNSEDTKSVGSSGWFRSLGKNSKPRRHKFDPEKVLPEVESHYPLKPARNPPVSTIYDYIPPLRLFKWIFRTMMRRKMPPEELEAINKKKKLYRVESNVPVEICLVLSSYTAYLMKNNLLQPAIATGVTFNITLLQDTLSNLERIRNTPLPFAYQFHLRVTLWLYLALLPFQIYSTFGYYTIPGTLFTSFLFLGFLEIGQEIENPFNYDLNDLDLDHFCLSIQRELHEITAYAQPDPSSFIFDPCNIPFAPSDRRSAAELVEDLPYQAPQHEGELAPPGIASIRHTLVNSWKQVDRDTRPDRAPVFVS